MMKELTAPPHTLAAVGEDTMMKELTAPPHTLAAVGSTP